MAEALPWGPDSDELCRRLRDEVDLLVASDVVYWAILFEPLLHTMRTIMRPSVPGRAGSYLYMSHYRRRKQDKRFFVFARKFFIIDEVMSVPCDQLRTPIVVLRFQLRPGSGLP